MKNDNELEFLLIYFYKEKIKFLLHHVHKHDDENNQMTIALNIENFISYIDSSGSQINQQIMAKIGVGAFYQKACRAIENEEKYFNEFVQNYYVLPCTLTIAGRIINTYGGKDNREVKRVSMPSEKSENEIVFTEEKLLESTDYLIKYCKDKRLNDYQGMLHRLTINIKNDDDIIPF